MTPSQPAKSPRRTEFDTLLFDMLAVGDVFYWQPDDKYILLGTAADRLLPNVPLKMIKAADEDGDPLAIVCPVAEEHLAHCLYLHPDTRIIIRRTPPAKKWFLIQTITRQGDREHPSNTIEQFPDLLRATIDTIRTIIFPQQTPHLYREGDGYWDAFRETVTTIHRIQEIPAEIAEMLLTYLKFH